jgi:hypothetical protein
MGLGGRNRSISYSNKSLHKTHPHDNIQDKKWEIERMGLPLSLQQPCQFFVKAVSRTEINA